MISVQCPYCSATIKVEEKYLGRKGKCGGCKRPIIMAPGVAKPVDSNPEPVTVHDESGPFGDAQPDTRTESAELSLMFGTEVTAAASAESVEADNPFSADETSSGENPAENPFGDEAAEQEAAADKEHDQDATHDSPLSDVGGSRHGSDPEANAIGLSSAGQHVFVECPHCDVRISISSRFMGRRGRCKTCGGIFRVPAQVPARASEDFDPFGGVPQHAPAMPSDIFSDPPLPPNPFAANSVVDDDDQFEDFESPATKAEPAKGSRSSSEAASQGQNAPQNQHSEADIFASEGENVLMEGAEEDIFGGDEPEEALATTPQEDDSPSVLESLADDAPGHRDFEVASNDSKTNIALHVPRPIMNRAPSSRHPTDYLPLIIEGVEVLPIALEAKQTLNLAGGTIFSKGQKSTRVVLKLTGSNGVVGWSEVTPSPLWSPETCESVVSSLRQYLAPAVVGLPAWNVDLIARAMDRAIQPGTSVGQPLAKSAIDMALQDLLARSLELPLHVFWGTKIRSEVWISYVVSAKSPEDAVAQCRTALGLGYNAIKLAIGMEGERIDREIVAAVAEDLPDGTYLGVDANRSYSLEVALRMAAYFQKLGVAAFEQPIRGNRISAFRELVRMRYLPIAVDETFLSPADLMEYIRADAVDLPVVTLQRVGGHGPARRLFHLAEAAGLRVMGGGLAEGDLGMAHCVQSYGAFGVELPCDLIGRHVVASPYIEEGLVVRHGRVAVPEQPGCGVVVSEELLRGFVVNV